MSKLITEYWNSYTIWNSFQIFHILKYQNPRDKIEALVLLMKCNK